MFFFASAFLLSLINLILWLKVFHRQKAGGGHERKGQGFPLCFTKIHQKWILSRKGCHELTGVQFSRSVVSNSLWPHGLQHARPPCPSPTPGVYSNSCPSSRWCHQAISSSVVPFSSCPQSLPASGSFPTSQLFAWGGQSSGASASASVLPVNTQDWSPLGSSVYIQSSDGHDQANLRCW